MRCSRVTKLLPLQIGGDLPARRGAAVARHLAACASCQEAATELSGGLAELRRQMTAAAPRLRSVRAAVVYEIERETQRRRVVLRLRVALAATATMAATVAVVLVRGWLPAPAVAPASPVVAAAPTSAPAASLAAAPATPAPPPPPPHTAVAMSPSRRQSPTDLRLADAGDRSMKITLLTDDPEVVIYWLVEPEKENADV